MKKVWSVDLKVLQVMGGAGGRRECYSVRIVGSPRNVVLGRWRRHTAGGDVGGCDDGLWNANGEANEEVGSKQNM